MDFLKCYSQLQCADLSTKSKQEFKFQNAAQSIYENSHSDVLKYFDSKCKCARGHPDSYSSCFQLGKIRTGMQIKLELVISSWALTSSQSTSSGVLILSTSLNLYLHLHPSQDGWDTMVIHAMESMSSPKDNAAREGYLCLITYRLPDLDTNIWIWFWIRILTISKARKGADLDKKLLPKANIFFSGM